jgi:UDP-N-acetyl-D-galactosamine dehydrogenase
MGLTFKENCPDLRNSGVVDMVDTLKDLSCNVDVYDPRVDKAEAKREYGIELLSKLENDTYDAIIIAVAHDEFKQLSLETIKAFGKPNHLLYDVKYLFTQSQVDGRL